MRCGRWMAVSLLFSLGAVAQERDPAPAEGSVVGRLVGHVEERDGRVAVGMWILGSDGAWRPPDRARNRANGSMIGPLHLAPGRYRFQVWARGREARSYDVTVQAGKRTTFDAPIGPKSGSRVRLRLDVPDTPKSPDRVHLTRIDHVNGRDVSATLAPGGEFVELDSPSAPRPGAYALILWDRGLMHPVTVTGAEQQDLQFTVPKDLPHAGDHELTVRAKRGDTQLYRFLAVLRRPGETDCWMRWEGVAWKTAVFKGLAPGKYELLLYDGVFGVHAGFPAQPSIHPVEVTANKQSVELYPFETSAEKRTRVRTVAPDKTD
ncbi:MAG: hypothetical protein AAGD14_01155 [Planctomycetota bacterium]